MPERRLLNIQNLDEAVVDSRELLARGYFQAGKWNLAQTLGHCCDWMRFPMEGYPRPGFPVNLMLWLMKATIGTGMRRRVLSQRAFKPGGPTMPETVKQAGAETDAAAIERFAQLVERFKSHRGPFHASPLFGSMTPDEHMNLQIVHLQHHLGFLIPKGDPAIARHQSPRE